MGPVETLAEIVAKVADLHQPQPIYGECWHAPDYGCTPVEVPWVDACNQSIEGWYCRECCTVNDVYLEHLIAPGPNVPRGIHVGDCQCRCG